MAVHARSLGPEGPRDDARNEAGLRPALHGAKPRAQTGRCGAKARTRVHFKPPTWRRRFRNTEGRKPKAESVVTGAQSCTIAVKLMRTAVKRVGVLMLGWAFILLGIAGLFLPVLQGILFLLIGLFILSTEYVWAHKLLQRIRQRFPRIAGKADEAARRAAVWMRRMFGQSAPR